MVAEVSLETQIQGRETAARDALLPLHATKDAGNTSWRWFWGSWSPGEAACKDIGGLIFNQPHHKPDFMSNWPQNLATPPAAASAASMGGRPLTGAGAQDAHDGAEDAHSREHPHAAAAGDEQGEHPTKANNFSPQKTR